MEIDDILNRIFLRAEMKVDWLEQKKIPQLREEIDRRTDEMLELRETVSRARGGDADALIALTRLAFPLKGKD